MISEKKVRSEYMVRKIPKRVLIFRTSFLRELLKYLDSTCFKWQKKTRKKKVRVEKVTIA